MSLLDWAGMAAASLVAAILQGATGFGFGTLAIPLFLLVFDPGAAIHLGIIVSLVLSIIVVAGVRRALDRALLLRLALGGLIGLPLGVAGFAAANPIVVRAIIGAAIVCFAAILAVLRLRRGGSLVASSPGRDVVAGAVAGASTALVGLPGPPVLIYLMLGDAPPAAVRATLLGFFVLSYTATLAAHLATVGVAQATWLASALLIPFAWCGGLVGRRLGDRLGHGAFAALAIAALAVAGLYTLATALRLVLG